MISNLKKQTGFTLVELVIAIAIIGILLSVAVPGYRDYVHQSNRAAATGCLLELSQFMERNYTQNMRYNPDGFALPQLQCATELAARYQFSSVNAALGQRTYILQAVPTTIQQDGCGTLTLDQAGRKGANGGVAIADVRRCW